MVLHLRDSRILLTGGGGFLGQHFYKQLRSRGAVSIFSPASTECDLTDARAVNCLFADIKPDVVAHLAAKVGGIGANRKLPGTLFRDNMLMGVNVIEAARAHGVKKTLIAGTICSYPKFTPVPFREDDLWNGYPEETNAPYGIAKKALLVMAQAYRQEFGTNVIVVFPVNLYGPGDDFETEESHVIPAMIRKFVDARSRGERTATLWGDGTPTREFLYVKDAASAIVAATERYDHPDPVNIGAGFEISIAELARKVAAACGYCGAIAWDTSQPNGQPRRTLDVSRAKAAFGWEATTSLDAGLAATISWYVEHRVTLEAGKMGTTP